MGGQDGDEQKSSSISDLKIQNFTLGVFKAIDGPVTYLRENIVEPLQAKNKGHKWYHRRFNRVPTIDQCDLEDPVCIYEADQQFYRDKMVDSNIVKILRNRKLECIAWEGQDFRYKCRKVIEDYNNAATNWFIKYGDLGYHSGSIDAYMKQKHRLLFERRNPDKNLYN